MGTIYRNGIEYPGSTGMPSFLVHVQTFPVKYNSTKGKWEQESSNTYNRVLLDAGFVPEVRESSDLQNLAVTMNIDRLVYNPLVRYSLYHVRVTLMRGTNGYDSPFASGSNWCTSLAADRVNSYVFRADNLNTYQIPIQIRNVTEMMDWQRVIMMIEIYGGTPTLKS